MVTLQEFIEKSKRASELMNFLDIPVLDDKYISKEYLFDLFMNKEKCHKLISKLNNKAFW